MDLKSRSNTIPPFGDRIAMGKQALIVLGAKRSLFGPNGRSYDQTASLMTKQSL
jgi:hypothetical protein